MSKRITEAELRKIEGPIDEVTGEPYLYSENERRLIAEVRRLRGLLMLAVEEGEDMMGNLPPEVEAEAKAIRAEEGK